MKTIFLFTLCSFALVALFCSCDKDDKEEYPKFDTLISADNIAVTPSILEAVGGKVPCTITVNVPPHFTFPTAEVTLTPYLICEYETTVKGQYGGFRGEDATDMGVPAISYETGGKVILKSAFTYVPEMATSELFLEFDVRYQERKTVFRLKIADGVTSTM